MLIYKYNNIYNNNYNNNDNNNNIYIYINNTTNSQLPVYWLWDNEFSQ